MLKDVVVLGGLAHFFFFFFWKTEFHWPNEQARDILRLPIIYYLVGRIHDPTYNSMVLETAGLSITIGGGGVLSPPLLFYTLSGLHETLVYYPQL